MHRQKRACPQGSPPQVSPLRTKGHGGSEGHSHDENINWEYPEGEEGNIRNVTTTSKSYKDVGVTPEEGKAYWDANPGKYQEYLKSKKRTQTREDVSKTTVDFNPDEWDWKAMGDVINKKEGKNFTGEGIRAFYDKVGYDEFNKYIGGQYPYMMTGPKRTSTTAKSKTEFKDII